MNEVFLLSHTATNWTVFSDACKSELGYDPLTVMANSVYKKSMPSFVGLLGLNGKMDNWLRDSSWKHIYLSFMTIIDDDLLRELISDAEFDYTIRKGENGNLTIISGNLLQWHDFIIEGCRKKVSIEHRQFANKLYIILIKNKYEEIFNKYKQQRLDDETFILEIR